jgi:acetylornithine deacetylase
LVERHVEGAAADDAWLSAHPPGIDYPGFLAEGWAIGADAPLVSLLGTCHRRVTGEELETSVLLGTADARYFDQAQGEQAVYYGPQGGNMHGPDEYVELESIVTGAQVLAHLILEWCK